MQRCATGKVHLYTSKSKTNSPQYYCLRRPVHCIIHASVPIPPSLNNNKGQIVSRQTFLRLQGAALLLLAAPSKPSIAAEPLVNTYTNQEKKYSLSVPASWEQYEKAGADSIFRDPNAKSTNVGVTVLPVRIKSLSEFGDLETVTKNLVNSEKEKESTLSVTVLSSNERNAAAGLLYDITYELETTRGRKAISNTVTIVKNTLYIVSGQVKCDKETCNNAGPALEIVNQITQSFQVLS